MHVEKFKGSLETIKMVQNLLNEILMYYGCVTVADYYDIIGYTSVYTDSKYGWISLYEASVQMSLEPNMYELVLPKAMPLE